MPGIPAFAGPRIFQRFELKAMRDTPAWMLELVRRFNLSNTGFCKYATAWRLETLFRGFMYAEGSEPCTGSPNWI